MFCTLIAIIVLVNDVQYYKRLCEKRTDPMPITSKYSNEQIESLVNELLSVLQRHKAPVDLSLIAIGNMATHVITERLPVAQQASIADSFASALMQSVKLPHAKH